MILYFSATGNTRFVAECLADHLQDKSLSLLERIKNKDYSDIHSDTPFIICSPIYVCEMPRFLTAYLKKVELTGNRDVYCIFTSGGYAGPAGILARSLFLKKNMRYRGCAELKMPRNYIASDSYPELEMHEIEERIVNSYQSLPAIADVIQCGDRLRSRHVWFFETVITVPFNPVWCRLKQPVKAFYADERCIACGKCVAMCPLTVIRLIDRRPVWDGQRCAHCMSCIQNCPVEAIEYGDITQKKKRYLFNKYRGTLI